jgi:hypothetical protein
VLEDAKRLAEELGEVEEEINIQVGTSGSRSGVSRIFGRRKAKPDMEKDAGGSGSSRGSSKNTSLLHTGSSKNTSKNSSPGDPGNPNASGNSPNPQRLNRGQKLSTLIRKVRQVKAQERVDELTLAYINQQQGQGEESPEEDDAAAEASYLENSSSFFNMPGLPPELRNEAERAKQIQKAKLQGTPQDIRNNMELSGGQARRKGMKQGEMSMRSDAIVGNQIHYPPGPGGETMIPPPPGAGPQTTPPQSGFGISRWFSGGLSKVTNWRGSTGSGNSKGSGVTPSEPGSTLHSTFQTPKLTPNLTPSGFVRGGLGASDSVSPDDSDTIGPLGGGRNPGRSRQQANTVSVPAGGHRRGGRG